MRSTAACLFLASMFLASVARAAESQLDVFQRRIAPILASKNASSCSECHLSGVDLKAYIDPDPTKTFAALRAAGLIDVKNPRKSKLLEFIARQPEKPSLVTQKIRKEEYDAFAAWIEAAVKDPKLAAAKADAKLGPELPVEVLRHARRDRVLASFVDNVWSEVGRCAACHSPDRNQEQVKKHGAQVSWITLGDPQATLDHMLEHDLIDVNKPTESLLLQKPTNQVKHGGGVKMTVGDRTYQQFAAFITDYSKSKAGEYQTAKDLPAPRAEMSTVSDVWLKITDVPADLDQLVLRAEVYPWNARTKKISNELYATGDRQVFGKGQLWQQHLTLVAPRGSQRAKQLALPPGKYVVRIYVDRENKLAKQVATSLGKDELVGEVPIETQWPAGYGQMTVVRFPASR
jgi:mono/diheme cytochrome c family protein